jgi:ribosomal protein S18 acetylase RimI-like enzyme
MVTDARQTPDNLASPGLSIRAANESQRDQIVALIVLAFSADPIVRWVYPDPHQFLSSFPVLVRAFGGKAFEHGTAYFVEGFTGAALWLPPEVHPDEEALGSVLMRTVPEERHEDMFGVLEQMGSYHPTEPHWYLPMIGVEPAHQGKGYGSALLCHTLEICDRHHHVAHLESSNLKNIPLYQRHGFHLVGEIQSGSSPTITPMTRDPR